MFELLFSQAEDRYDMGDYEGSVKLAKRAQRWIMWSVAAKVLSVTLLGLVTVIYFVALLKVMHDFQPDGEEVAPTNQ